MTHPDLRVVVIGFGLAGSTFHAPVIDAVAGMRVTGVVTGNAERAARARQAHPGVAVHASVAEVWEQAGDYDVAVVTTPNDSHAALAVRALELGLAVVVDKPLARTAAEAQQVLAAAARAGRPLSVFHNRRWDGDFRTLSALVAAGRLGAVRRLESRFERWRPQPKPGWREASVAAGGGLLLDLGSHLVDQALVLLGPVSEVYAELDRRRPGVEVEDDVFLALTHESGARSALWASAIAPLLGPRLRVLGDAAGYEVFGLDPQEPALRDGGRPGDPGWGEVPPERWGVVGTVDGAEPTPTLPGAYQDFYVVFARAVREGGPVPVDPKDALATLRVLDAARVSADQRRVVAVAVRP